VSLVIQRSIIQAVEEGSVLAELLDVILGDRVFGLSNSLQCRLHTLGDSCSVVCGLLLINLLNLNVKFSGGSHVRNASGDGQKSLSFSIDKVLQSTDQDPEIRGIFGDVGSLGATEESLDLRWDLDDSAGLESSLEGLIEVSLIALLLSLDDLGSELLLLSIGSGVLSTVLVGPTLKVLELDDNEGSVRVIRRVHAVQIQRVRKLDELGEGRQQSQIIGRVVLLRFDDGVLGSGNSHGANQTIRSDDDHGNVSGEDFSGQFQERFFRNSTRNDQSELMEEGDLLVDDFHRISGDGLSFDFRVQFVEQSRCDFGTGLTQGRFFDEKVVQIGGIDLGSIDDGEGTNSWED